jgi:hypothetical protein
MASLVQNKTSPEQKCTGEFGALAGDKSPSLPGTTNRGFGKSKRKISTINILKKRVPNRISYTFKFFTTTLVNAVSKTGLEPKNQLQVNLHQAHELFDLASYLFLERS